DEKCRAPHAGRYGTRHGQHTRCRGPSPAVEEGAHDAAGDGPVSSSRRGFLRDRAAAAARAIPDPPEREIEIAPEPLLDEDELERYSRQLLLPEWAHAG